MPSETATALARGRPREFEADAVLDALVELFWEKGYEATSMTDIVASTGLSKSSLYSAFGSKDELFDKAINRYVDHRTSMVTELLSNGTRGLDDLIVLFDSLWAQVNDRGDHRGCLAVNTSAELGLCNDRIVAMGERFRGSMSEAIRTVLGRSAALGEIDSAHVDRFARVTLSSILGLSVLVRSGASNEEVREHLDAVLELVTSWRGRD